MKQQIHISKLLCAFIVAFVSQPGFALTIVPVFDSSITNDPQGARIQETINQAVKVYESSFSDDVRVLIKFISYTNGVANSGYVYVTGISYATYVAALKSHATTAYDAAAIAHLPNGSANPVNGNREIYVGWPNARALGLAGKPDPTQPDGTVYINTRLMNLDRKSIDPSKYDLLSLVSHEINEVLGFNSALGGTNGAATPTGPIWPLDLFRYDQNRTGTRSFNTSLKTQAYFSLDGTNLLVRFNQTGNLDFGDWYGWTAGVVPQVQDSATVAGATADLGIEKIALDVMGFTLVQSSLAPAITTVTETKGTVGLTWSSVPALPYHVEYTTNCLSNNWTPLDVPITATNSKTSALDYVRSSAHRFYRVVLLQ